jgi:branched-chain amino acid transport system permease protein
VVVTGERVARHVHWGRILASAAVTGFLAFVIVQFWNPNQTIDANRIILFLVVGVTLGSIYAVAASGLVVTYTTSGIFNFAQGAIGMFLAFIYWELKVNHGLPTLPALFLTVFVAAPLMGAAIEVTLMRRLANAPLVAQLVVTIGLMLALIGLADTIWPGNTTRTIGTFFGSDGFTIGTTFIPYFRVTTIVVGILIAVFLRLLLFRTRLGVTMRAVVDGRDLAALNGARPERVSMFSWALGSSMAAVAGIFLAEEFGRLGTQELTIFIVQAFAAAIIGRLRSLPMTLVGGLIIGLSLSFQRNFLDLGDRFSAAGVAIPAIILFLALLFLPEARLEGRRIGHAITARVPSLQRALFGFAVLLVVAAIVAAALDRPDLRRAGLAMVTALAMLSLVPLTGWSGQISFAQITFVGIGAWAYTEFSTAGGRMFNLELYDPGSPWGLVAAALVAVPVGLLMALPALRLQGLYLALASMAFALMAPPLFFSQEEVFGNAGRDVAPVHLFGHEFGEPFEIFGIEFARDAGFLLLAVLLFCVAGFGVVCLRRSRFSRRLIAMRDSPAACATLGVNLLTTKLAVFGISAAIAGLAGALLSVQRGAAQTADFEMLLGLPYLLLLVVGGVAVVSGALFGAVALQMFTWLLIRFPNVTISIGSAEFNLFATLQRGVGAGLAGIGIGRQPDGVIPHVSHEFRERRARKVAARRGAGPGGGGGGQAPVPAAVARPDGDRVAEAPTERTPAEPARSEHPTAR